LLSERGFRRIALVSHRTHLFRAPILFQLTGLIVVTTAGVPAQSAPHAVLASLYEAAALPHSVLGVLCRRR
jgi:uncharacterized SAM-binding protein YcdF (DUF218 family)